MLLVDAGSFLTRKEFAREMVDELSVRAMKEMGYAATTIGYSDLYMGVDYFRERVAESGLTVVSANVYDESTGERVVEPYAVVNVAGVKFGITGVLDHNTPVRTHRKVETSGVGVTPPDEELEKLLPEIRKKADYVVLLSHLGLKLSKELAERIPGIDFVVVGNQSGKSSKPFEVGGAVFLQPGTRGQNIADYRLTFDGKGDLESYDGTVVALDEKVPGDAAMALELKEHKLAVDELNKQRAAELAKKRRAEAAGVAGFEETCLGVDASCVRCHREQYDKWKETPHAHAFETLEAKVQSTNPQCLRCHTTCQLDLPLDGSVSVPEGLRGVQCEACHGMGTSHARDGSYGAIRVETCLACHDKENSPNFSLATYLPKVMH